MDQIKQSSLLEQGGQPSDYPTIQDLIGQEVVLDLSSPYVYLGRLIERQEHYLLLQEVDAHDLRDTQSTRERYVLEARLHGIQANREWAWVNVQEIVSISRLADVRPQ